MTGLETILEELEGTHMHVIGSPNTGKSKFLEALLREAHSSRTPFTLFDWHGTLYKELLAYLTFMKARERVFLLDLAETEYVTSYNPFETSGDPDELSGFVESRIDAAIRPFGAATSDETPRLGRILYSFFSFMAETEETLPNASAILRTSKQHLRRYAASVLTDEVAKEDWSEFSKLAESRFDFLAESTLNRLARLLQPLPIRRMIGRASDIKVEEIFESGSILLVNLNGKTRVGKQSSRLVAALLLIDFFRAALRHTDDPRTHLLVLDEFQEYVTSDVAPMLDQVRKSGLHLVLANQRHGQLARDEQLADAVATDAQMKAVFGGLDYETAAELAQTLRLPTINREQVAAQYYAMQTTSFDIEMMEGRSRGRSTSESSGRRLVDGSGTGYEDERTSSQQSEMTSEHAVLVPYIEERLAGERVRSRDEKVSLEAEKMMRLDQRHCFLKLPGHPEARHFVVQKVNPAYVRPERLREYQVQRYIAQGSLSTKEHDAAMAASQAAFEQRAKEVLKEERKRQNAHRDPRENTRRPRR